MASNLCPVNSDNLFEVRVDVNCRAFDFTLVFEEILFSILPSIIFLLWLMPRLAILQRSPVKSKSFKLAIYKSVCMLFFFFHEHEVHLFTVYRILVALDGPFCLANHLYGIPSADQSFTHQSFNSSSST